MSRTQRNVLVAAASKHGSTHAIAEAIAQTLQESGTHAVVRDAREVRSLEGYDAVVLGSAVYMGDWMPEARAFVDRHIESLVRIPVWLFSSGPIGDPPKTSAGDNVKIDEIMAVTEAIEHRIFSGKLDRHDLGISEKIITSVTKAPEGDFRNWGEIIDWSQAIAHQLYK